MRLQGATQKKVVACLYAVEAQPNTERTPIALKKTVAVNGQSRRSSRRERSQKKELSEARAVYLALVPSTCGA